MIFFINETGGPGTELARQSINYFCDTAVREGIDLSDFDPGDPLSQRIAWAESQGLSIGCTYLRYSSAIQHSTNDQLRENIHAAARMKVYIPPELICMDEAKKGRSTRRQGLARLRSILNSGRKLVFVLFTLSRLYRNSYKSHDFRQCLCHIPLCLPQSTSATTGRSSRSVTGSRPDLTRGR